MRLQEIVQFIRSSCDPSISRHADRDRSHQIVALINAVLEANPKSEYADDLMDLKRVTREQSGFSHGEVFDPYYRAVSDVLRVKRIDSTTFWHHDEISIPEDVVVLDFRGLSDTNWEELYSSTEVDAIRGWVRDGGVAWVAGDWPSMFDIDYQVIDRDRTGTTVAKRSINPQKSDLVNECESIEVGFFKGSTRITDEKACTLFEDESGPVWSVVPYGKGWVSDVKRLDESALDGARFWLNFRLFCIKHAIPPPQEQTIENVARESAE